MIKTVLFGAGPGAIKFIGNTRAAREFIAIFDNDEKKHGTVIDSLLVKHPQELVNVDYEQIVITTQWAQDVKAQLINELKVSPDIIVVPKKNEMKNPRPFENTNSLALARDIVIQLSEIALRHQVDMPIDFGTLLGVVRDDDIIAWDDDIDFAAPIGSDLVVEQVCKEFIQQSTARLKWTLKKVSNNRGVVTSFLLSFDSHGQDIKAFVTSICFRQEEDHKSLHLPSLGMWFAPAIHFQKLQTIEWRGHTLQVPYDYKDYLHFLYGEWQTPKKDIQFDDYANLQSVSIEQVKQEGVLTQEIGA